MPVKMTKTMFPGTSVNVIWFNTMTSKNKNHQGNYFPFWERNLSSNLACLAYLVLFIELRINYYLKQKYIFC